MNKIVFTGGGTGGHIFPVLAIIRELKKNPLWTPEVKIYFLGPSQGEGIELLKKEGVRVKKISNV